MNYTKELNQFTKAMEHFTLKSNTDDIGALDFTVKSSIYKNEEAFSNLLGEINNIKRQSKISRFISISGPKVTVDVKSLRYEQFSEHFETRLSYGELQEIAAFLLSQGYSRDRLQSEIGINNVTWCRIFANNTLKSDAKAELQSEISTSNPIETGDKSNDVDTEMISK